MPALTRAVEELHSICATGTGSLLARSAQKLARVASVTGQETALTSSRRVVGVEVCAVCVLLDTPRQSGPLPYVHPPQAR